MKTNTPFSVVFTTTAAAVFYFLWDRSEHFNLWIAYLSPCIFPAILLMGFGAAFRRAVESGHAPEGGFAVFLRQNWKVYVGLIGLCAVALWLREDFQMIPYVLFFGTPYFLGIFFATILLGGLAYGFWPGVRFLWPWFWFGFAVFYGVSIVAMFGQAWTAIPLVALILRPALGAGGRLLRRLRASGKTVYLVAGALTLAYWWMHGFWRIPWYVRKETPTPRLAVAILAGVILWVVYRFGGGAIRRGAGLLGRAVGTFVLLTVVIFGYSAGAYYVGENYAWVKHCRYKVILEAESEGVTRRAEGVITVERKVVSIGQYPAGQKRVSGELPTLMEPGGNVRSAHLDIDRFTLHSLPKKAMAALKLKTGDAPQSGPIELVGEVQPSVMAQLSGGFRKIRPVDPDFQGIHFRSWIEVLEMRYPMSDQDTSRVNGAQLKPKYVSLFFAVLTLLVAVGGVLWFRATGFRSGYRLLSNATYIVPLLSLVLGMAVWFWSGKERSDVKSAVRWIWIVLGLTVLGIGVLVGVALNPQVARWLDGLRLFQGGVR